MGRYAVRHKATKKYVKFLKDNKYELVDEWNYTSYDNKNQADKRVDNGRSGNTYWSNIMEVKDVQRVYKDESTIRKRVDTFLDVLELLKVYDDGDCNYRLYRRLCRYYKDKL